MSTCAFYYPRNIEVDLAALPTWLYSEIISLHGHITRPTDTNPPVLTCLGNGEPMYIRRQETGRFFAVHFPGGNPDGHRHGIGRMSVEHENQSEYCLRAATSAGLKAAREVSTGSGTRLDVAVFGDLPIGLEIQRSTLSRAQAKSRTTKSAKAGFTCAWISDSEVDPQWADHVATARLTSRGGWDRVLPANTAQVIISDFTPERDRSKPGGWRYARRPTAVLLDELSVLMPAGQIIPVQIGSPARRRVVLAHKSGADVVESCTYKGAAKWTPDADTPRTREAAQALTHECHHLAARYPGGVPYSGPPCPRCGTGKLYTAQAVDRGYCGVCKYELRFQRGA